MQDTRPLSKPGINSESPHAPTILQTMLYTKLYRSFDFKCWYSMTYKLQCKHEPTINPYR